MKCEEFETIVFDAGRDAALSRAEREAAFEHARVCPRCAAAYDLWQELRVQLRGLAEESRHAQAPASVKMRLRQQFREQARTRAMRRVAALAAGALATAAVWVAAINWHDWRRAAQPASGKVTRAVLTPPAASDSAAMRARPVEPARNKTKKTEVQADNAFTFLLGTTPIEPYDGAILRVRMQRGALGALGLPVNEERAGEWIHVDLLVAADGQPQAVRLAR